MARIETPLANCRAVIIESSAGKGAVIYGPDQRILTFVQEQDEAVYIADVPVVNAEPMQVSVNYFRFMQTKVTELRIEKV